MGQDAKAVLSYKWPTSLASSSHVKEWACNSFQHIWKESSCLIEILWNLPSRVKRLVFKQLKIYRGYAWVLILNPTFLDFGDLIWITFLSSFIHIKGRGHVHTGSSRLLLVALIFMVPVWPQGRVGTAKPPARQKLRDKSIKCEKYGLCEKGVEGERKTMMKKHFLVVFPFPE